MRHVIAGLSAVLLIGVGAAACKKAATPPAGPEMPGAAAPMAPETKGGVAPSSTTAPTAPGGLTADEIAGALSKAVCTRMSACEQAKQTGQPPVAPESCASMMSKDLAQALPEKARAINRDQLTTCVAAIDKATCDELNAESAPKGCEFMD